MSRDRGQEEAASPRIASGASADSIISADMVLGGDCETDGALRVDGHVKGSVRAGRLTVGPGGRVDGDVTGTGGSGSGRVVVIEGQVGGAVRAPRVEVGTEGSVGSGLEVHEGVIEGHVRGPIEAEHRLVLEDTATVEGDVTARRLGLKEGGRVFGTIRIGQAPGTAAPGTPSPEAETD
ncbi:MAG: polymer-forming cytoskeletal protein [Longimicrobiales bacterium]